MSVVPVGPAFSATVEALRLREWHLGPGQPTLVMDQLTAKVRGYQLSFDTQTPADIVAAAVARALKTSRRVRRPGAHE